jgi:hypothetical protein
VVRSAVHHNKENIRGLITCLPTLFKADPPRGRFSIMQNVSADALFARNRNCLKIASQYSEYEELYKDVGYLRNLPSENFRIEKQKAIPACTYQSSHHSKMLNSKDSGLR